MFDDDDHVTKKESASLKINKSFADKFEQSERTKELNRVKFILDQEEEDESDSETEDEEGELLTQNLDLQILKTINMIRKKDPKIYDKSVTLFVETESNPDQVKSSSKKMTYKDVAREQLLSGDLLDDTGLVGKSGKLSRSTKNTNLLYNKEQEELRSQFLQSINEPVVPGENSEGNEDEDSEGGEEGEGGLFRSREVSQGPSQEFLESLEEMKRLGRKTKEEENADSFLASYFAQGKWKENAKDRGRDEGDSSDEGEGEKEGRGLDYDVEEEEALLDATDLFESKYNFRFEEMGAGGDGKGWEGVDEEGEGERDGYRVVGHSRQVEGGLRRVDDKRKKQREERKERKEREKRQKEEELKRLKNLKKKELEERLKRVYEIAGIEESFQGLEGEGEVEEGEEGEESQGGKGKKKEKRGKKGRRARNGRGGGALLSADMLDDDWDPAKHEEMMRKQFGDEYYEEEDDGFEGGRGEAEEWMYEGVEGVDEGEGEGEGEEEQGEGEGGWGNEDEDGKKKKKRKNKKSHSQEEEHEEDVEGGEGVDVEAERKALLEEVYKLDFEDLVGGVACRFKYSQVEPEDFGLDTEDILLSDDRSLNQYVSLKHLAPYRYKTKQDLQASLKPEKLSRRKWKLRQEVMKRKRDIDEAEKKRKGIVEKVEKEEQKPENDEEEAKEGGEEREGKKKRRRRNKGSRAVETEGGESEEQTKEKEEARAKALEEERKEIQKEREKRQKEKEKKQKRKEKKMSQAVPQITEEQRRLNLYT